MPVQYSLEWLEEATETLRAVAHPLRLAIIGLLYEHDSLSVTEIYEALDIEQAVASHHLRILKAQNVVQVQRDAQRSLYSLSSKSYWELVQVLQKAMQP